MFDHVVAVLHEDVMHTVLDIITEPGETPYATLKAALVDRHSMSESRRVEELLSGAEMGDRRPSEFYRHMHAMAGTSGAINDQLVVTLWMRRLPQLVQAVLKGNLKLETQALLTMADNVYEVSQQHNRSVFSTSASSSSSTTHVSEDSARLQRLEKEISELKSMFSRFNMGGKGRSRSRSRDRSRGRDDWCWYHNKHGADAKKCNQPCKFASGKLKSPKQGN